MKFATLRNGTTDGRLVLVSRDGQTAVAVPSIAPSRVSSSGFSVSIQKVCLFSVVETDGLMNRR